MNILKSAIEATSLSPLLESLGSAVIDFLLPLERIVLEAVKVRLLLNFAVNFHSENWNRLGSDMNPRVGA